MKKGFRKIPPKSEFRDAVLLNNDTYFDYLERMKKIVLSLFEWEGLPNSMNARWLERCLYYQGQAGLLYDEEYGFINTAVSAGGYLNIYGLPTELRCWSLGGFHARRSLFTGLNSDSDEKTDEAILVMNNWERVPTSATIELFALRLAEAQRTCDINIKAQRTPVLLPADQKQIFTLKKVYEQYDGNTPVIFPDKNSGITSDMMKVINTEAPYIADKVKEYQTAIWNEFLTFIGVSNLSEKKERLITSEVDSNNELINLNLQSYLAPRKKACEEFNKKFGMNINVKIRSDLYNIIKQAESITEEYKEVLEIDNTLNGGKEDV